MFSIIVIYFREFLEISLIIGVVAAATKNIANRSKYVILGIVAGIIGSILFAYIFSFISENIEGEIEDIFIATIMAINVVMIIYTITWMDLHSKIIAEQINKVTSQIQNDNMHYYAISSIIAFAVIREGIEIALFTYGIVVSSKSNVTEIFISGLFGSFIGITTGFLTYFSIVKLPIKIFFKVTKILLSLFAANLASQIPIYLDSAQVINFFSDPVWDSSSIINEQSIFGKILHSLIGYTSKPSLMQIIFYFTTIAIIYLFKIRKYHLEQQKAKLKYF